MRANLSVKNKIFFLFVFVIVISLSVVGWYGFSSAKNSYIDSAILIKSAEVESLGNEIEGIFETVPQDVTYNVDFFALEKLLIWKDLKDQRKIKYWSNIYCSTLEDYILNKKLYYKIRIIDENADEVVVIKYDKKTDKIVKIPEDKLQNKAHRDYFKKSKKLKKGEFYISAMSLNMEYGEVEKPYTPVVRYISPIIDSNAEKRGIVVLSFNATNILNKIADKKSLAREKGTQKYYLLNKNGYYLYNKDTTKRWGFQLGNDFNFQKDYPNIFERFKDKHEITFIKNDKIFSMQKIYPNKLQNPDRFWYLVTVSDKDFALSSLDTFTDVFFLILFLVLGLGLLLINISISKLVNPLVRVTSQLKALSVGEIKKENIIYSDNDEIGDIVKSTNILVDSIETTTSQAKAVARGDFSSEIKLLGQNDKLGLALTQMMKRLKEVAKMASTLSNGNYDVDIDIKDSDDELGIAIGKMIVYLENISQVTEAIASGDINVEYKLKGEDDRLGLAVSNMIEYLQRILKQANLIINEDYSQSIEAKSKNDELGLALAQMTKILRENSIKTKTDLFLSEGFSIFSNALVDAKDKNELSKVAISEVSRYIKASSGVVYLLDEDKQMLNLIASYAPSDKVQTSFKVGSGVIGEVALERKVIHLQNIKDDTFLIQSATTKAKAKEVYVFPLIHEEKLLGVVEVMSFESFSDKDKKYLHRIAEIFAISLFTTIQNSKIKTLLEESQKAYEEMQIQSEELQESNTQMEEQQQQLTIQAQELNERNENILKAKNELEKASAYKNEFLANMSHELRTPLNSIILLSKLLTQNQNKTLDESDIEKTSVIHKAGNELLLLINDILDLSKIESGNMEFEYDDVSSNEIVTEMKGLFSEVAKEKKLDFIVEDHFNDIFSTDKTKLSQVLKNLLSNAFKFTKEGSVVLSMTPKEDELKIVVKDTGIGIPNDKLALIFEAFKQVDGSISREFGGTGLGLSISKTIVDLMGGEISVESKFGEGTSFIVKLPLKRSTLKNPYAKPTLSDIEEVAQTTFLEINNEDDLEISKDELKGKNILIVDDDSRNIFALTSIIESMDGEVFSAFSGKEALEVLEEGNKIDLILMDIMMPIMDGLEAIKDIKAKDKYKKIPIIAVTAKTMPQDKQACLDAGADDYLSKPINNSALVSTIRAWIK